MNTQTMNPVKNLKSETVESLQELIRSLQDSSQYLVEASTNIDDKEDHVARTFKEIAGERMQICTQLQDYVAINESEPADNGTFLGTLRTIWSQFRAGLNAGDPKVVLIEAERAEDAIVAKFKQILPEIAGNPLNDKLNQYFAKVKQGHDRILDLRNTYQAK